MFQLQIWSKEVMKRKLLVFFKKKKNFLKEKGRAQFGHDRLKPNYNVNNIKKRPQKKSPNLWRSIQRYERKWGPHLLIMRMKYVYLILFIYFINIYFSLMIFSMSHFWCWLSNSTLNTDCIIQTYIGTKHILHISSLTILDAIKKDAQINS